ncbi:hypothetical protein RRG08_034159 [Elysia crispata]|uniref:Uncharacterized protein n=1 Tax=Elysia crispata TaxID=231223 RepID=A0AAE0ZKJ4_9GAST|nr:hypothetical protein RRG08_034159 [Elysia crispata]
MRGGHRRAMHVDKHVDASAGMKTGPDSRDEGEISLIYLYNDLDLGPPGTHFQLINTAIVVRAQGKLHLTSVPSVLI